MDAGSLTLWAIAAAVATWSLLRLMLARRAETLSKLQAELAAELAAQAKAEAKAAVEADEGSMDEGSMDYEFANVGARGATRRAG